MALQVTYKGRKHSLLWTQSVTTLQDLAQLLASELHLDPDLQKIVVGGRQLIPSASPDQSVEAAGIHAGSKILVFPKASPEEIAQLQAIPDQRIRGFDDELLSVMRRRQNQPSSSTLPSGPYTFQRYESWNRPGLQPAPSNALKLLHRLAADKGIIGIMTKHRYSVGALTEMPPHGKVGVSPVCILGVNINSGQEISLRLRTDDLKGFRRYDRIRETLIHELAHMVWGEHDHNFKELNSQLLREATSFDWTSARTLFGESAAAPISDSSFVDPSDIMAVTAQRSGQKLGGHSANMDARTAAGLSAMQRTGQPVAQPPVAASASAATDDEAITGLGHHDDMTEELEEQMRALGSPEQSINPTTASRDTLEQN